jgi:tetraacyldisaccharide 4'-kinase
MTTQPASLQRALSGEPVRRENLKSRYVAFSGIGNPGAFESSLRAYLGSPVSHEIFDDHHWYSAADMQRLEHACALQKAEYLVTTQKDAMRLTALGAATELDKKLPILVLRIVATMTQGGQEFMKRLEAV